MLVTGVILRQLGEWAEVSVAPLTGCSTCGRCTLGREPKIPLVKALNPLGAAVGSAVVVELDPQGVVAASAWLYLMPLALLLVGLTFGYRWSGNTGALVLGLVAIGIALTFIRYSDRWWQQSQPRAVIVELCNQQD